MIKTDNEENISMIIIICHMHKPAIVIIISVNTKF